MFINVKVYSILLLVISITLCGCATSPQNVGLTTGGNNVFVVNGMIQNPCKMLLSEQSASGEEFSFAVNSLKNKAAVIQANAVLIKDVENNFWSIKKEIVVTADFYHCTAL